MVLAFLSHACVRGMALEPGRDAAEASGDGLLVFTVRTQNAVTPSFRLVVSRVYVAREGEAGPGDDFRVTRGHRREPEGDGGSEAFVSIRLPPGSYRLTRIEGSSSGDGGDFVHGPFDVRVDAPFELHAGEALYAGRLDVVLRPWTRRDDGREGFQYPLFRDRERSGFRYSVFDVAVSDRHSRDWLDFGPVYPSLGSLKPELRLLALPTDGPQPGRDPRGEP